MTAEAGERFAGLTVMEAREAVSRRWRPGPDRRRARTTPRGALLAPLGRAHRAAALAAVVHEHGRRWPRRRSRRSRTGACASSPSTSAAATCTGWRTSGLVHLAPALVGPPPAGLLLRGLRGDHVAAETARALRRVRRASCARTRTCSTPGSRRRCGRSPRSVGPRDAGAARRSIRPTCSHGPRHPLPVGGAHDHDGPRFTGEVPFSDVYIHSVIQAPDGAAHVQVAGHRHRPAGRDRHHGADAVRFGLLAMSSTQDVRYSAEKVGQGQALANKLFNAARFVLVREHRPRARA